MPQNPQNINQESLQKAVMMIRSQMVPGGRQFSIDEIVQETGAPPEIVANLLNEAQGRSTAQTGADGGITAAAGPQSNQDMTNIINQGNAVMNGNVSTVPPNGGQSTDNQTISDIVTGGNATSADQEVESEILDLLDATGIDELNPEDEGTLLQRVQGAILTGSTADGELDQDSVTSVATVNEILKQYGLDPEGQKAQMEIYRTAAKDFYDPAYEDIKGAVPLPDQALPYLVAGAALIQSGEKGDSWGTALSNAFLRYGVASKQEDKAYRDKLATLDINKAKGITDFMGSVHLANIKDRTTIKRALVTSKRMPYAIGDSSVPKWLTEYELKLPQYKGATAWQAAIKPYAVFADKDNNGIPDPDEGAVLQLLPQSQAAFLAKKGFIVEPDYKSVREKKWYIVDGAQKYWSPTQLEQYKSINSDATIRELPGLKQVAAFNIESSKPEFATVEQLVGGPNGGPMPGFEHLTVIPNEISIEVGPDGSISAFRGPGSLATGILTPGEINKESKRLGAQIGGINSQFNQLLGTIERTTNILDKAIENDTPIAFGGIGRGVILAGDLLRQFEQASAIIQRNDSGYTYYIDANNNGKRDPDEGVSHNQMQSQFADEFESSNLGKYLMKAGLQGKRLHNMLFTLAIQTAGIFNMKGRDVSDKDIVRFLQVVGAEASSEEQFRTMLMDLAGNAIAKRDSDLFEISENDFTQILEEGQRELMKDPDYKPKYTNLTSSRFFKDGLVNYREDETMYTQGELTLSGWREKIKDFNESGLSRYAPSATQVDIALTNVLPIKQTTDRYMNEDITFSGADSVGQGSMNLHDKWQEYLKLSTEDAIAESARLKETRPEIWKKLILYDRAQQRSGNYTPVQRGN